MYLNQEALWSPVVIGAVNNLYADNITSAESIKIKVRRQEHVEEIRLSNGTVHKTKYIYYTHDDVKIDDKLDGHLVVDSYDMRSLSGRKRLRRLKTI